MSTAPPGYHTCSCPAAGAGGAIVSVQLRNPHCTCTAKQIAAHDEPHERTGGRNGRYTGRANSRSDYRDCSPGI